ncbi:hypothetical protein D3C72_2418420 [compost metagenome]
MAKPRVAAQLRAGDALGEGLRVRGRDPAVALAPQHQRGRAHAAEQVGIKLGKVEPGHHLADGLAAAFGVEEVDVAAEGGLQHA